MNFRFKLNFKKTIIKTSIIFGLFVIINFLFISKASAATLKLVTTRNIYHQQEQFLVDVYLLPEKEEHINAFDLSLNYSPNVSFIESEDGSSITSLWIEKPKAELYKINFSGIIPGGFTGLIDPTNSDPLSAKKPGLITRLIFSGNQEGIASFDFGQQDMLSNDGLGTELSVSSNILNPQIDDKIVKNEVSSVVDEKPPQDFIPILSKEPLLFNGKYSLNFETVDKESGIDHFEVKEDGSNWKIGTSPYVLSNQPPTGTIYIKAIDKAGNFSIEQITPNIQVPEIPTYSKMLAVLALAIAVLLLGFLILVTKKIIKKMQGN